MQYLLCFGNPYLESDNLALRVADEIIEQNIPGLIVIKCINPEQVMEFLDKDFYIVDVVKDLKKTGLITDINVLKNRSVVSMHDFDLGFFLKLMAEMGRIKKIRIIGIPQQGSLDMIKKDVLSLLPIQAQENV